MKPLTAGLSRCYNTGLGMSIFTQQNEENYAKHAAYWRDDQWR